MKRPSINYNTHSQPRAIRKLLILLIACLTSAVHAQTYEPATSNIYTGGAGETWNHRIIDPYGIKRVDVYIVSRTGGPAFTLPTFKATRTPMAYRGIRVESNQNVTSLCSTAGGTTRSARFRCDSLVNHTYVPPALDPMFSWVPAKYRPQTQTGNFLPDEIQYTMSFPSTIADGSTYVVFEIRDINNGYREIRYVLDGCNKFKCG